MLPNLHITEGARKGRLTCMSAALPGEIAGSSTQGHAGVVHVPDDCLSAQTIHRRTSGCRAGRQSSNRSTPWDCCCRPTWSDTSRSPIGTQRRVLDHREYRGAALTVAPIPAMPTGRARAGRIPRRHFPRCLERSLSGALCRQKRAVRHSPITPLPMTSDLD